MTVITQAPKICPSCRVLTPINQMKKITSRSSGKSTNSWRCFACMKRKAEAVQATKQKATESSKFITKIANITQVLDRTFESCWAGQGPDWPMRTLKSLLNLVDSAPGHQESQ